MACYWAGAAVNPINIRWSANEIAYSLDDCDTRILLVDDSFAPLTPELLKLSRSLQTLIHLGDGPAPQNMLSYEALVADSSPVEDAMRNGDDLAGVFYTGGTTGSPKGVMLCHRNLYTNAISSVSSQIVRAGSIGLHAAPMFHLADGAFMNALLAAGGCHVMVPRFDPLAVLQAIASTGVTDTLLVPTMIQMLVDHPDLHKYDLKSLRQMAYGASPISEGLLDRAMRVANTLARCDVDDAPLVLARLHFNLCNFQHFVSPALLSKCVYYSERLRDCQQLFANKKEQYFYCSFYCFMLRGPRRPSQDRIAHPAAPALGSACRLGSAFR